MNSSKSFSLTSESTKFILYLLGASFLHAFSVKTQEFCTVTFRRRGAKHAIHSEMYSRSSFLLGFFSRRVAWFWQEAAVCGRALQTLLLSWWFQQVCGCLADQRRSKNNCHCQNNCPLCLSGEDHQTYEGCQRSILHFHLGQQHLCKSLLKGSWISKFVRPWGGCGQMVKFVLSN